MPLPVPVSPPFPNARLLSHQGLPPRRSNWHNGIDLAVRVGRRSEYGTHGGPIAPGVVEETCYAGSARCSGYGNGILVRHEDDLFSWYAHLAAIYVEPGDEVQPGDHMYDVGDTFGTPSNPGRTLAVPHLHLELVHAGWPFAGNNIQARYDVLHELAAGGVGFTDGILVAGLDPFEYESHYLAADASAIKSFSPVPKELDWQMPTWPFWLGFGGAALAGAAIAVSPRRRGAREREIVRKFPRRR